MPILPFVAAATSQAERLGVTLDFIPLLVHFQSAFSALEKMKTKCWSIKKTSKICLFYGTSRS